MGNNVKIPLKNRLYAANLNGLTAFICRRTLDNFFRMGIIYLYIKQIVRMIFSYDDPRREKT